jgi:hypothetical protein
MWTSVLRGVWVLTVLLLSPAARAETYALLVGINDYPRARPLKGAVNDIRRLREVAAGDLFIPEKNITVLLNEQATKVNILGALRRIAAEAKPGDSLLWYYSGHGWMVHDGDGDEGRGDQFDKLDEVLVPFDGAPFPKDRAFEPNPTFVSDDEIAAALSRLVGRRVVVVFDSCHSGTATRSLPGEESGRALYEGVAIPNPPKFRSLNQPRETLDIEGHMVFIAAAGASETASDLGEYQQERHGALTASLLRTIRKTGPGWPRVMTWDGLFRQARADMLAQGFGGQTPSIASRGGLGKLTVEEFFRPSAAGEISGLPAAGPFGVQLEANKYRFEDGELLEVAVQSERDGYLYVFDIDAARKVTQLYPNRFQPENRIAANALRTIPGKGDRYQFRAGAPFGPSTIVAIVTTQPWTALGAVQIPDNLQPIGDAGTEALRAQLRTLEGGRAEWASQRVLVEIAAKGAAPPQPPPAPPVVKTETAAPPSTSKDSLDDSALTPEEQADLPSRRPALFRKLTQLAERFSPVFWQDVGASYGDNFRPWKDFFVRYDFDQTELGPNWPAPPQFQDENKRRRNQTLDSWLKPSNRRDIVPLEDLPGVYRVTDRTTGETVQLDLRPTVYWAVLTTSTHYFFHYVCFKAEDWKFLFGHAGDMEGTTIVVDRASEKMVAAFTLAHDDVQITRDLDDAPEANIEVLVDPALETRAVFGEGDGRPVNGALGMEQGRDGGPAPKEHQDIYSESMGHGQYGPHKIKPGRYIVYANFLPEETWRAPSFDRQMYPKVEKFGDVPAKHKYQLVYIGSSASPGAKTLWAEYHALSRFPGGANPPWDWRDNLFFKTGWWRDPQTIKKIGDPKYRFNPYLR